MTEKIETIVNAMRNSGALPEGWIVDTHNVPLNYEAFVWHSLSGLEADRILGAYTDSLNCEPVTFFRHVRPALREADGAIRLITGMDKGTPRPNCSLVNVWLIMSDALELQVDIFDKFALDFSILQHLDFYFSQDVLQNFSWDGSALLAQMAEDQKQLLAKISHYSRYKVTFVGPSKIGVRFSSALSGKVVGEFFDDILRFEEKYGRREIGPKTLKSMIVKSQQIQL
ncbi:MAG: hypothetical protein V4710_15075 [Verrucomicrobiota bacterium]